MGLTVDLSLVPVLSQYLAAVHEVVTVRREYFQGERSVIADRLQRTNVTGGVDQAGAQWEMKIRASSLIVVQVHVAQPLAECRQNVVRSVAFDHQVRMADVQMQAE